MAQDGPTMSVHSDDTHDPILEDGRDGMHGEERDVDGDMSRVLLEIRDELRNLNSAYDPRVLTDIRWELQQERKRSDVSFMFMTRHVLREVEQFISTRQLSFENTVKSLKPGVCLSRFGDGELRLMLRPDFRIKFQENSPALADDLRRVLRGDPTSHLLIGFPRLWRNAHWSAVWLDIWDSLQDSLRSNQTYGNGHSTRPIFFETLGQNGVDLWRNVWAGQAACVVTGADSRFDLTPELFDNLKSVRYEYSQSINAYSDIDRLLDKLCNNSSEELTLISLGPAGTILAAELSRRGLWALDIGHLSASFENVFKGGKWPEARGVTISRSP